jgi:hypothetical protein
MTIPDQPSAGGLHPAAVGGKTHRPVRKHKTVKGDVKVKNKVVVSDAGTPAVVKSVPGTVTTFDKIKKYYKFLVAAVGAILIVLNQATPVFHALGGSGDKWFTSVVAVVAAAAVLLKDNEHWVDSI